MSVVPIKKHRNFERHTKRLAAGVLRDVRAMNPTEILVIGHAADGSLIVQGYPPDPGNALWLIELAKKRLLGLE